MSNRAGYYRSNLIGEAEYKSFVPSPLPPMLQMDGELIRELAEAHRMIGMLEGKLSQFPYTETFVLMSICKEALMSSQIEGIRATFEDVLAPAKNDDDAEDAVNNVEAIKAAIGHLGELPICSRLIRQAHGILLSGSRGQSKEPGEYRHSQNWIGRAGSTRRTAIYVPPNVEDMKAAMRYLVGRVNREYDGDYRWVEDIKHNILSRYLDEKQQQLFIDWNEARLNAREKKYSGEDVSGFVAYWRSAGEVEARNAEKRAAMTPLERSGAALADTEDVKPHEDQIIKQVNDNGREVFNQPGQDLSIPEQQIKAVRKQYKGIAQWMKAPNGSPTNLKERQWLTVRTPAFKRWFGDWENDPQNASQALDENGEPLVLYHRTRRGQNFSIFEIGSQGAHFGTRKQADSRGSGRLYSVFLNVRNPMRTTDQAANWNWEVARAKRIGHDGLIYLNEVEGLEPGDTPQDSWAVFRPEQIKSADKNNGNFDPTDPDIYHQIIGKKGAERLNNGSMDSLALAEQMEKDGLPAFAVWRITGWNRGKDGQWRTEIMDGQLREDFVSSPRRRTVELHDAYDNPALYDAYPELLHMPLRVQKLGDNSAAYYDNRRKSITINQTALQDKNYDEVKTSLIHEIQHAIQDIEGFDNGGGITRTFYKWSNKLLALRYDAWRFLSKEAHRIFADACTAMANGNNEKMKEAAASMPEEAQNIWAEAVNAYNRMQAAWNRYASISGEVEARNAETRSGWDEQKRRSTPLFASEDYKRSEQTRNFVSKHDIDQFNQLSRLPTNAEFVNGALPARKLLDRRDKGYGVYLNRDLTPVLSPLRLKAALPDGRIFERNASGSWSFSGGNLDSTRSQILDDIVQSMESTLQENGYKLPSSQSFSDLWEEVIDRSSWGYQWRLHNLDEDARFFGLTEEEKDVQRKEYQAKITFIQDLGRASVSSQDLAELTSSNYLTGSPDDNELLDWNSDMQHQPDKVQAILRRAFRNFDSLAMTGEQLYRWLAKKLGSDKNASLWLHKKGIPGLRYSEGTRSGFVVWDTRKLQVRDIFSFSDEKAIDSFNEARLLSKGQTSVISAEDIEHAVPKEQVAFVRRLYEGTDKWMKAPNGKPTKLTKIQWLIVRTPAFKAWFGDWELDPQNASKILDENGEPRVVYRGSHIGDTLHKGRLSRSFTGGRATLGNHQGQGIWAHSLREGAATYGENVYPVFLNIRDPYILDAHGRVFSVLRTPKDIQRTRSVVNDVFNGEYGSHDGVVFLNIIDIIGNDDILGDVFVAFERSKLKSALKNSGLFSHDTDIYNQTAKTIDDFTLTPDAQAQYDAVARQFKGTAHWLKAPNGKDTHLTERQWVIVRTPNFKRWFGDWELDPQNASKVLDENGEPMVVYHGTQFETGGFSVFNTKGRGKTRNTGAWFNSSIGVARTYFTGNPNKSFYPVFLNIRNPYIVDAQGKLWRDIPLEGRHKLFTTNEIVREVWKGKMDKYNEQGIPFDGVIIKNVEDNGSVFLPILGDDYVVKNANQIKSATKNNGEFSPEDNIYHQFIGFSGAQRLDLNERVTTRMDALKTAIRMEKKLAPDWRAFEFSPNRYGVEATYTSAEKIWRKTGWFRGADGQWKYEIPYGEVKQNKVDDAMQRVSGNHQDYSLELADVFDAPVLFSAYLDFKHILVDFVYDETEASTGWLDADGHIGLNVYLLKSNHVRQTLIHEIQHYIQSVEGFAAGGAFDTAKHFTDKRALAPGGINYPYFAARFYERQAQNFFEHLPSKQKSAFLSLREAKGRMSRQDFYDLLNDTLSPKSREKFVVWDRLVDNYESYSKGRYGMSRTEAYMRFGGEVEARNAAARSEMSESERLEAVPTETQDMADSEQIIFDANQRVLSSEQYQQAIHRFSPEIEQQFSDSFGKKKEGGIERLAKSFSDFLHGFRGDYAELARAIAAQPQLMFARETLRMMNRESDAKTLLAVQDLAKSLKGLSAQQLNIFVRYMLLNDIRTFWKQNPNAKNLPLDFTPQSLKQERERFIALVNCDIAVKNALLAEHQLQKNINERLAAFAQELNMPKLAERVKRNSFYILDYARLLKGKGINSNYFEAVVDTRTRQLKDITRLQAVLKLRNAYSRKLKAKLVETFGSEWRRHIPQGYKVFNPLKGSFIHSAKSLTENLLGAALEAAGQQLGLSQDTMKMLRSKVSDNEDAHLLVLPEAIADTLDNLAVPVFRGHLGKIAKAITTGWKKMMLFFPTRAIKYNIRNITGDLDAAIAGNPHALAYVPQAISELYRVYYGDGEATPELREFQKRGGAVTIQSTQDLGDYKQLKEAQRLINELKGKNASVWAALPRKTWALLDKVAWSGIQNFSDFREQWIRYACYLDYIHQMQSNDEHMPANWGASVRAEVLSIPAKTIKGIRDRAFKMSNELIGAYDQVSESGKSLRDILIPFYSWMEVNAKRYYQLIKNGITEDGFGDFASRFLKGELANAPYYAFKLAKTYLFINLLAMLIAAFNHFVWPEDEEKLPPDIQAKPHITLGHDTKGNVLYFDRVGAMLDNLEWFGQEESPFLPFAKDVKDIFDGRQTFTGLAAKFITSPLNKLVAGLTPLIKTPMELIAGQTVYPDFTNPRNINDRWQYLAQSFGLAWPYKAATGQPVDNWREFKSLFLYSADADEAAYFYTLGLVRKFQEDVLGKRTGGFAVTQRGKALRRLKAALRLDDDEAVKRSYGRILQSGRQSAGVEGLYEEHEPSARPQQE